ncbi:MAG TPA: hypothetical protein VK680_10895 [Solirubrobacteraceae bacterium]|jgi:hypothetical protein|nr:hypothetical protein [Solirubrobacteraceae bacterium]
MRASAAARTPSAVVLALASALLAAGCGGGARMDAGEAAGTYAVKVVHASFPTSQAIAHPTSFALEVENTGTHTVPNIAVTVDSFNYASNYPELAADKRPVWAIERGPGATASPPVSTQEVSLPGGGQTAYVNTWALGALAPGKTRTFIWHVVPVKAGAHTVHYSVAAGLAGKAKARLASGAPAEGQFAVNIAPAPKLTHVNPSTGHLEAGEFPANP